MNTPATKIGDDSAKTESSEPVVLEGQTYVVHQPGIVTLKGIGISLKEGLQLQIAHSTDKSLWVNVLGSQIAASREEIVKMLVMHTKVLTKE